MKQEGAWLGCRFEVLEGLWDVVGRKVVLPGELPADGMVNQSGPAKVRLV